MRSIIIAALLISLQIVCVNVRAQNAPQPGSAQAAAISDTRFITLSIQDNQDAMYLSQTAADRATDQRVKEFAQQMHQDHSGLLYSMQQLQAAGGNPSNEATNQERAAMLVNESLSTVSGADFDSVWVAGLLTLSQAKYDQLTQAKTTVTNPQLKMVITEAIPIVRKHVSQLKSIQKYLIRAAIQKRKEEALEAKMRAQK